MQVGYIGLLRAINNFDWAFRRTLAAYARPCITGEIKADSANQVVPG